MLSLFPDAMVCAILVVGSGWLREESKVVQDNYVSSCEYIL
jgi:hypothetical protein